MGRRWRQSGARGRRGAEVTFEAAPKPIAVRRYAAAPSSISIGDQGRGGGGVRARLLWRRDDVSKRGAPERSIGSKCRITTVNARVTGFSALSCTLRPRVQCTAHSVPPPPLAGPSGGCCTIGQPCGSPRPDSHTIQLSWPAQVVLDVCLDPCTSTARPNPSQPSLRRSLSCPSAAHQKDMLLSNFTSASKSLKFVLALWAGRLTGRQTPEGVCRCSALCRLCHCCCFPQLARSPICVSTNSP